MTHSMIVFQNELQDREISYATDVIDVTPSDADPNATTMKLPTLYNVVFRLSATDPEIPIRKVASNPDLKRLLLRTTEWNSPNYDKWVSGFKDMHFDGVKLGVMANLTDFGKEDSAAYALWHALSKKDLFLVPMFRYSPDEADLRRFVANLAKLHKEIDVVPCLVLSVADNDSDENIELFYKKVILPVSSEVIFWSYHVAHNSPIFKQMVMLDSEYSAKPTLEPILEPKVITREVKPEEVIMGEIPAQIPASDSTTGTVNVDTLTKRVIPSLQSLTMPNSSILHRGEVVKLTSFWNPYPNVIFGKLYEGGWVLVRNEDINYIVINS